MMPLERYKDKEITDARRFDDDKLEKKKKENKNTVCFFARFQFIFFSYQAWRIDARRFANVFLLLVSNDALRTQQLCNSCSALFQFFQTRWTTLKFFKNDTQRRI